MIRRRTPRVAAAAAATPFALGLALAFAACTGPTEVEPDPALAAGSFYALEARALGGAPAPLAAFAGDVALVVNTASECGFTPQYAGLQALYEEYGPRGLVVLGFPSNDFGAQEPGSAEAIRAFCDERFAVTFPLFEKVRTAAGEGQSPVYAHLGAATGKLPGWNFSKYLVDREGQVVGFWPPTVKPDAPELRAAIEAALGA